VEGGKPFLVLAGIIHPKLMVSSNLVAALGGEELAVALRHEHAHRVSQDNLKRLLVLLAPGVLPVWRGFGLLERAWARFTEWAADDYAVDGDPRQSVTLASTLVRVARLGACPDAPPLVTSLLADDRDLAQRVDRLLKQPTTAEPPRLPVRAIGLTAAVAALAAMLQPATLYAVHGMLEHLTR
jgi:beta-lactamase regulating signal transducer with metallopeptidase domain